MTFQSKLILGRSFQRQSLLLTATLLLAGCDQGNPAGDADAAMQQDATASMDAVAQDSSAPLDVVTPNSMDANNDIAQDVANNGNDVTNDDTVGIDVASDVRIDVVSDVRGDVGIDVVSDVRGDVASDVVSADRGDVPSDQPTIGDVHASATCPRSLVQLGYHCNLQILPFTAPFQPQSCGAENNSMATATLLCRELGASLALGDGILARAVPGQPGTFECVCFVG